MARPAAHPSGADPRARLARAAVADPERMDVGRIAVVHAWAAVDGAVRDLVSRLRSRSHETWSAVARRDLVDVLQRDEPDLVVVWWQAGAFDLGRLCRDLRASSSARILVVADADTSEFDDSLVIDILDGGADDFVSSTIGDDVLMARVRVALRARPVRESRARRIVVGDVEIDLSAHSVKVGADVAKCPPLQFQLLALLAREPGVMVHRETLFRELWGVSPGAVDGRRLRIAVSILRGILGTGPQRPVIETAARTGYRLVEPAALTHDG